MDEPKSLPVGGPPANLPVAIPSPQNPGVNLPPPAKISGGGIAPRSSIRTMESDIKSAQTGQAPKGMEVKPPVFSAEPLKPAQPVIPPKPPVSVPPAGIKLGEAEQRTSPLPGQITLPSLPKPEQKTPEIKVSPAIPPRPLPLSPILPKQPPVPPLKTPFPPTPSQGGVSVPPKSSIFGNKKVMAGAALAVIVVLGGILYLRLGQTPEQVSSPTPTPSITTTPPDFGTEKLVSTLDGIFGQTHSSVFPGLSDSFSTFQSGMVGLSNENPDKNILVSVKNPNGQNYQLSQFLDQFSIGFPINLVSFVDNKDFALILTKQTEFFDQGGKLITSPSTEDLLTPKIALAVRVVDAVEAQTKLTLWEDTLSHDLSSFYGLEQIELATFSDNAYQGLAIRFLNFTHPDKTIDYAIVMAKNGNDYLVIANSREQIYSIIDKLLGF